MDFSSHGFIFTSIAAEPDDAQSSSLLVQDRKIKRAQSLVGFSSGRPDNDFYPTPPEVTLALLERETFTGSVIEPACGDGAISKILVSRGHHVVSTDLVDRGYGAAPHDFLSQDYGYRSDNLITNPPFSLAQPFIEKALTITTKKVAILVKLQILEGAKRRVLFENSPLKAVYVFSKRVNFYRNGVKGSYSSSMMAFCWLVFEHGHGGEPVIRWI